jgi:hypothetical protein
MRAAVVLAALVFKYWLVYRMMTPQDIVLLRIAAFGLLVLMLTIMGGCTPQKPQPVGEPFCSDREQRRIDYDFEYCEFKQRRAFGASRPHEGLIA